MDKPVLIEEKELFKGLRFSVVRKKYAKRDGLFERDIVIFPQAVVVLPFITRNEVILIKQFRASSNDFIIEAPAGVVDEGETPDEAAKRELVEEIGYYPRKLIKLGEFMPTPGYSTEILHFYYAENLEYVGAQPEKYEIITPFRISFNDAYKIVLENKIVDAKTALIILLYYNKHIEAGEL
ncbi:MAG: NUDIX hydrolase [Desulfurococcaceae archaeon]